jgi:hypothetical protein
MNLVKKPSAPSFQLITLPTMADARGKLTVLDQVLPFEVRRSFWIYGADGHRRGGHRHHATNQALIAMAGMIDVFMDDGEKSETISMTSPDVCLIVEPKDWHYMDFKPGSILLVFASHGYDKDDYIHEPYERS